MKSTQKTTLQLQFPARSKNVKIILFHLISFSKFGSHLGKYNMKTQNVDALVLLRENNKLWKFRARLNIFLFTTKSLNPSITYISRPRKNSRKEFRVII